MNGFFNHQGFLVGISKGLASRGIPKKDAFITFSIKLAKLFLTIVQDETIATKCMEVGDVRLFTFP